MINFSHIDLNLLRTLDVLLAEHNVTRAAKRLHLSQPSVSIHLSRLRELFNDPILIPSSRGMKPTTFAEEIREPLRNALFSLETAVKTNQKFDPTLIAKTWRLAAADYAEYIAIQPAMNAILKESLHCRLSIRHMIPERLCKQLERGEIDLAFHLREKELATLKSKSLFKDRYVLAGRANHPALSHKRIDLPAYHQLGHAIVSPNGGGFSGITDDILKSLGLTRNVILSVPDFQFLIAALKQSDLVAMVPARLALNDSDLTIVEPPVNLPDFELVMLWHERSHRDPAHQWLRKQFILSTENI